MKFIKLFEEQTAFDEAKSGVAEINTKIAQRQAEGVKEKFALTSDAVENAVELAESQVGVHENGSSNDSADIRKYKNGRVDGNPADAEPHQLLD